MQFVADYFGDTYAPLDGVMQIWIPSNVADGSSSLLASLSVNVFFRAPVGSITFSKCFTYDPASVVQHITE